MQVNVIAILHMNEARAGMLWLTRRYVENTLMKLSAFEQSPSEIVGSMPMGFPSCWADWALPLPCPLPPGAPPPSGGPPPPPAPGGPPPDRSAPPAGVLDCSWVMMAMVINILVLPVSEGQGAVGII